MKNGVTSLILSIYIEHKQKQSLIQPILFFLISKKLVFDQSSVDDVRSGLGVNTIVWMIKEMLKDYFNLIQKSTKKLCYVKVDEKIKNYCEYDKTSVKQNVE